jgi:hypothetical protein
MVQLSVPERQELADRDGVLNHAYDAPVRVVGLR